MKEGVAPLDGSCGGGGGPHSTYATALHILRFPQNQGDYASVDSEGDQCQTC